MTNVFKKKELDLTHTKMTCINERNRGRVRYEKGKSNQN